MNILKWSAGVAVFLGVVLWFGARHQTESVARATPPTEAGAETRGAVAFEGAAFGGLGLGPLETNAVPWRLVAAALVLEEQQRDPAAAVSQETLLRALRRFGFLTPAKVLNRAAEIPEGVEILPLGMTYGDIAPFAGAKIRVANLGCAACHAGVTYDSTGAPQTGRVMLGMPNTSINLEAYTLTVFEALRRFVDDERLLETAAALFPEMSWRERVSLSYVVMPLAVSRIEQLAGKDRPMPFTNGVPGATNGVAALKAALKVELEGGGPGDAGVVSVPDLGSRVWRTSLLADGAYAVPGEKAQLAMRAEGLSADHLAALAAITTFFTVPSMGVHPDDAFDSAGDARDIMQFLKAYRPQPFPGSVDTAMAGRGRMLYARACASCHGDYSDEARPNLVMFPNWQGDAGTDGLRAQAFSRALGDAVSGTAYDARIAVRPGNGYVAPPLTGLWASAPYLHNGSVPTLWALLSPDQRPPRFQVGGHALDLSRVGLRIGVDGSYPAGYTAFADPVWIDTQRPGLGNQGHRFGEEFSDTEKLDLIEFLKGL
ncbi:MAG: hypothetical protein ACKVRO_08420 [Micropepsaceae bacterium]